MPATTGRVGWYIYTTTKTLDLSMRCRLPILLIACLPALGVAAPPRAIVLAGTEVSRDSHYAYVGSVLPFAGYTLGNGLVARLWLDHVGYAYDATPATRIEGRVIGQEAALGWQWSEAQSWGGLYLGLRHGYLDLDPDDPANRDRGHRWRVKLQVEGETAMSEAWRANLIASHLFGSSNHWARLRLQTVLANGWHAGPELISLSAPDHRAWQLGGYLGNLRLGAASYLTVKAGVRKAEGESASGYVGAEFYLPF